MRQLSFIPLLLAGLVGFIFFAYHHDWIIVRLPFSKAPHAIENSTAQKKNSTLWYWKENKLFHDTQSVIWNCSDDAANAYTLINAYFSLLDDEELVNKKISVQKTPFQTG